MIYYFSAPSNYKPHLFENNAKAFLLSYAVDAKAHWKTFQNDEIPLIIDSGAFTVWNSGGTLDIEAYLAFCKTLPEECIFVNVDVIPETGSSPKDVEICCQKGYENFIYLSRHLKNVLPVYHYKDELHWLEKYIEHTDYIGISPANDTAENVKRTFLDYVFKFLPPEIKTHAFGYSSFKGLTYYPFYSIDSTSWKKGGRFATTDYWCDITKSFQTYDGREFFKGKYKEEKEMIDLCLNQSIKAILQKMKFLKRHHSEKESYHFNNQLDLF